MIAGRVLFVGCGPGAADLLTLRAIEAIERADIVIWSPSRARDAASCTLEELAETLEDIWRSACSRWPSRGCRQPSANAFAKG